MLAAKPAYLKGYVEHAKTFLKAIDGDVYVMLHRFQFVCIIQMP